MVARDKAKSVKAKAAAKTKGTAKTKSGSGPVRRTNTTES
jgi:hypothetical protein